MAKVVIIPVADKAKWGSLLGEDYEGVCLDSDGVAHVYASFNDYYAPAITKLKKKSKATVVLTANLTDNRAIKATMAAGYTFPAPEEEAEIDYSTMTVVELKALCKEKGISGYSSMNKATLIKTLEEAT